MDRRTFLQRTAALAFALKSLNFEAAAEEFTELNPVTDIYRNGALVSTARFDQILKEYYLPPVKEMLNSDPIFLGKELRVPMQFLGDRQYGMAVVHLEDGWM